MTELSEEYYEQENEVIEKYPFKHSDYIAKALLNKIISLAVRSCEAKIDQSEKDYCFEDLKSQINPMMEIQMIPYDYDDTIPDTENNLFYSQTLVPGGNSWMEIQEPKCPYQDRCCSDKIKNGDNEDDQCAEKEEPEFIQTKNSLGTVVSVKTKLSKSFANDLIYKTLKNTDVIKKELNKGPGSSTSKDKVQNDKKKKGIIPVELVSKPIEGENFTPEEEPLEFEGLRREMAIEMKQREEERKKKKKEEELKKGIVTTSNGEKIEIKKLKPIVLKNQTFNIDGTLIPKKPINVEKNSTEYGTVRANIKNIFESLKNSTKKMSPNKGKGKRETRKDEEVIRPKLEPYLMEKDFKDIAAINAEKIQPAGANFDLILPEIGVKVSTKTASKGGNKEFSKYFKKTSMEDYDKMLRESIPTLNKTMIQEQLGSVIHKQGVNTNNTNTSAMSVSSPSRKKFNNPLLSSTELNQNTSGNMESILEGVEQSYGAVLPTWNSQGLNSMQLSGKYASLGSQSQSKIFNLDNSIKMNEKFLNSSLKLHLDSIMDETNEDPVKLAKLNNSTVFNSNFLRKRQLTEVRGLNTIGNDNFSSINKFTKELANGKYGQKRGTNDVNLSSIHFKPNKKEIRRELGIQIMNTKLPRSRKYNHTVDESANFFKM